jgi:4-hydroxythreonine-4-phosphate dehydrogenase
MYESIKNGPRKPRLAITLGDPAGVGPETIVGAWREPSVHAWCDAVAIGQPGILRRAVRLLDASVKVVEVDCVEEARSDPETIPCLASGSADAIDVPPAQIDARGGQAAYDALRSATELALSGQVDGITTAPLNKAALAEAGHDFPGHTELLAHLCGVRDVAMMLYLDHGPRVHGRAGLGVVHVTLHTALRRIFEQISVQRIQLAANLVDHVMRTLIDDPTAPPPRIGVCALNPHAGEHGLFGCEESQLIEPAVEICRSAGLTTEGPLPADTMFVRAAAGDFDAVVAMYHDQGHIALKLLGMHRAVNITLGLPIVRTSVAHGTAFDLAWQGKAECQGMREALRVAARLVRRRQGLPTLHPESARLSSSPD